MKRLNDAVIIGVDHGYGNIKTANHIFKAGIVGCDHEPLFTGDMLVYGGKYYVIGEGHKEFVPQKHDDEDYYLLTLAGIAMELAGEGLTEADVMIAAGLPLTWTSGQKEAFAAYLTRNAEVSFTFRKVDYHVRILGARIYPQGYAAVAEYAPSMKGVNVVVDIGNGTMNTLFIIDGRPQIGRMFTEKFGTHQCTLAIREAYMREYGAELDEATIEGFLITGAANIPKDGQKLIRSVAEQYVGGIFRRLREHGYDESTMDLIVTGGGGCLVKNVHNHFVANSVSFRTGRKYENHKRDHQRLREVSDELCREHGLYVIENPRSHGLSFAEWRAHKDGQLTMKDMLELDMRECIDRAIDVQHFPF